MTSADRREPAEPVDEDRVFVKSLERGLAVIRAFDGWQQPLRITDVARTTGLTRSAARRFLMTLVHIGYARFDGQGFSLRPSVLDLGFAFLSSSGIAGAVQPHVDDLAGHLNQFTAAAVLDGADARLVACSRGRRLLGPRHPVGARLPSHATAAGQILLGGLSPAELEEVLGPRALQRHTPWTITDPNRLRTSLRLQSATGYSLTEEHYEEGMAELAVPLHAIDGAVVCALMVSFSTAAGLPDRPIKEMLPLLRQTAVEAERDLRRMHAP